jgi:hypothetical protein
LSRCRFLWSFVAEALGPEWQALDLGEFLEEHANRTGKRRHLFWLVFAAMTWTLWTIRNKMVIERIFLRRASDSIFKFLAFMQQWYPLCRQRVGSGTGSGWTACWRIFLWRLVIYLCSPAVDVLSRFMQELYLFFLLGMFVLLPQHTLLRLLFVLGT